MRNLFLTKMPDNKLFQECNNLIQAIIKLFFGKVKSHGLDNTRYVLRKKCPYSGLFMVYTFSAFARIWTAYKEIRSISPYSVWMRENAG